MSVYLDKYNKSSVRCLLSRANMPSKSGINIRIRHEDKA